MKIISIIGAGLIGNGVIQVLQAGAVPGVKLGGVLVRDAAARSGAGHLVTANWAEFAATSPDLILELAGPEALLSYGVAALGLADLWSISGKALTDPRFADDLVAAPGPGRLRLLAGAIGGLDLISAASVDPQARIRVTVAHTGVDPDATPDYIGPAREAIQRFHGLNVIAAVALSFRGLDDLEVRYFDRHAAHPQRRFLVDIESKYISGRIEVRPTPVPGPSAVVASCVSALRQRGQRIIVG